MLEERTYVKSNEKLSAIMESIEYIKQGYSIALMIDQRVSEEKKLTFLINLH